MGDKFRNFKRYKILENYTSMHPFRRISPSDFWFPSISSYSVQHALLNLKMSDHMERIEKMIDEIKALTIANRDLSIQNNAQLIKIHTLESQNSEILARVDKLTHDNAMLQEEARLVTKRLKDRVKQMRMEMRKRDVFGEVYRGSSKTKRDEIVNSEMGRLNNLNNILLRFVQVLESKFGFDGSIACDLCTIANGVDDPAVKEFIKGISMPRGQNVDVNENVHSNINTPAGTSKWNSR
ncbi:hypothetical protein PAEPH01_1464 [Pancytospora epiphaga]|nr:hypothetical protein PAEPH01_1464 [Pancytospora epiphaga]